MHTNLGKYLEHGPLKIPEIISLSGTDTQLPIVIVADKFSFIKPYSRRNLTDEKRIYNYRLS